MMDGIVSQLRCASLLHESHETIMSGFSEYQETGVWAWDCVENCLVLIIIWVLALLGDNPMQSELACHRGLMAKFFCRVYWVKGHDVDDSDATVIIQSTVVRAKETVPQRDDASSISEASVDSVTEMPKSRRSHKTTETMQQMVERVTRFMKVCGGKW
jgi:hypothetical protein